MIKNLPTDDKSSHALLLRVFLIVIVSIFVIEYIIMLIIHSVFAGVSDSTFALIDSTILVVVITPILFIFIFKPLVDSIRELSAKESELKTIKGSLEKEVSSRTNSIITLNESLEIEIGERIQAEKTLLMMAEKVSSKTGYEFFQSLLHYLSETLGIKYAFIGELQNDKTIKTISAMSDGHIMDNFTYELVDTPCNEVMDKGICIYKSGITDKFPKDKLLEQMGAESYGAIPLLGSDGSPMGLIAVLDIDPLEDANIGRLTYILKIIGARVASELERTSMERDLYESESRFREFADLLPQIAFEVDSLWNFTFLNKNFYTLTGYTPEEVMGKLTPLDMIPFEEIESSIQKYKLISSGNDDLKPLEINHLRKDGSVFPVLVYARRMTDEKGTTGYRGFMVDISYIKESEMALKASEQKYRTIFESAGMSLIIADEDLLIKLVNNNFQELTGYPSHDLEDRRKLTDLSGLEHVESIQNYSNQITSSSTNVSDSIESVLIRSDGREMTVSLTIALMPNRRDRVISVLDISEKQKLHDEAVRAAHLASLGSLAAGVAHEINNPINTVLLSAQHALKSFSIHDNEKDSIEQIIRESNRISNIVKSLLSFSRQEVDIKNPTSIMDAMYSALSITEHLFRRDGSKIINNISANLPGVYVNVSQIEQVFVNILINARHAVNKKYPDPSEDKIIEIDASVVEERGREYVRTVFCDHGTGMSEDIIEKAMNPFFTTKEAGSGTGLGLSISHGLIVDNGGTLRLESLPGEYTRVIIDLPLEGEEE